MSSVKTTETAKAAIIERLHESRRYMARLRRTGEYEQFANLLMNPNGVAEMSMGSGATSRDFKAARELEAAGMIVVVRGSLDGKTILPGAHWPEAYILEGPNFPQS